MFLLLEASSDSYHSVSVCVCVRMCARVSVCLCVTVTHSYPSIVVFVCHSNHTQCLLPVLNVYISNKYYLFLHAAASVVYNVPSILQNFSNRQKQNIKSKFKYIFGRVKIFSCKMNHFQCSVYNVTIEY